MNERPIIIAEAAQGFEGDGRLARLLVRAARAGQADFVKFQLVFADELATPAYQYYDLFKKLEMPDSDWASVAAEATSAGIGLLFDVFGERSLDAALRVGAAGVKLHATDFFNRPLLTAAFARAPHVYVSLGGIEYDDVTALVNDPLTDRGRLTLMFGFQGEPTPVEQNHIARLAALAAHFPGVRLGFMDHADGAADEADWLGVLAVAYGATIVEKHITLERSLQLEDWTSALGPPAFARYAARVRLARHAVGSAAFALTDAEREYGRRAIKAVVARHDIPQDTVVGAADIAALRAPLPEGRTVLRSAALVIGRSTRHAIAAGQPICTDDLE